MPATALPSPPTRRGACPGVFDPMESADGWLVRVRLPGGRITADQVRVVADVAERFGSGVVEVTSRANLQVRGVGEANLAEVGQRLLAAGLAAPDAAADVRRAVVASPLAGHDQSDVVDASTVVDASEVVDRSDASALAGVVDVVADVDASAVTDVVDVSEVVDAVLDALATAALPPLPAKFGVVIDGGGQVSVRHVPGTICLGAGRTDDGTVVWHAASNTSLATGPTVDLGPLPVAALAAHVITAAHTAAAASGTAGATAGDTSCDPGSGAEPIAGPQYRNRPPHPAMDQAEHPTADAGGPTASPQGRKRPPAEAVDRPEHPDDLATAPTASPQGRKRPPAEAVPPASVVVAVVGVLPHRIIGRANVVAQVFLGRTNASALAAVAELAGQALAVRTTPGGVALLGVPDAEIAGTLATFEALGLVVHPNDPRVGITACIGAPGCASARADTTAAADRLTYIRAGGTPPHDVQVPELFAADLLPTELVTSARLSQHPGHQVGECAARAVHLAACEKRCGAPFGALVLVADDHGRYRAEAV